MENGRWVPTFPKARYLFAKREYAHWENERKSKDGVNDGSFDDSVLPIVEAGKAVLREEDKAELCAAANQAQGMNNALLLVVGYTDSTGSQDFNQVLSEKRASRVVNHLQQACGWKPYRMLTPTGMAEADPAADNSTPEGKAQNRRVAVRIVTPLLRTSSASLQ